MTKPVEKREFWIEDNGCERFVHTRIHTASDLHVISHDWHEQEMARLESCLKRIMELAARGEHPCNRIFDIAHNTLEAMKVKNE